MKLGENPVWAAKARTDSPRSDRSRRMCSPMTCGLTAALMTVDQVFNAASEGQDVSRLRVVRAGKEGRRSACYRRRGQPRERSRGRPRTRPRRCCTAGTWRAPPEALAALAQLPDPHVAESHGVAVILEAERKL